MLGLKRFFSNNSKRVNIFDGIGNDINNNRVFFCTGMGRSGTHFLAELLGKSKSVNAFHLDEIGDPVGDSFYQYAKWHNLKIDVQPLFNSRHFLSNKCN
ncbi:MAG: hypothetical protein L3J08_06385, partial [Flavobacteriaceae bacterium]|nr:hypothetical protein [Flavobacteriaceae bacterium]